MGFPLRGGLGETEQGVFICFYCLVSFEPLFFGNFGKGNDDEPTIEFWYPLFRPIHTNLGVLGLGWYRKKCGMVDTLNLMCLIVFTSWTCTNMMHNTRNQKDWFHQMDIYPLASGNILSGAPVVVDIAVHLHEKREWLVSHQNTEIPSSKQHGNGSPKWTEMLYSRKGKLQLLWRQISGG